MHKKKDIVRPGVWFAFALCITGLLVGCMEKAEPRNSTGAESERRVSSEGMKSGADDTGQLPVAEEETDQEAFLRVREKLLLQLKAFESYPALMESVDTGEEKLNSFAEKEDDYNNGNEPAGETILAGFVEYLFNHYGMGELTKLSEASDFKKAFYELTGSSVYLLLDEYLNRQECSFVVDNGKTTAGITFAGDICLEEDGFVLDHYDTTAGLSECISPSLLTYMNESDVFMLNNEFSISDRGTPLQGKYYTFRAKPERVALLKQMGVDLVSLANNHVYDYGPEAMRDTVMHLDEAGILHVGGGNNREEAEKVIYLEVNGIKIGVISASRAEKIRYTPQATEDSPGIFLMYDPERLLELTGEAKRHCDYLVAYIHWGTEDSRYFEEYQHELAKQIFDAGADIIIGGHPHVLQGIEYIEGKPVVYSLGDFWFNDETKYTALLHMEVQIDQMQKLTILPCLQSGFTTTLLESEEDRMVFMQYVRELSDTCTISDNGEIIQ